MSLPVFDIVRGSFLDGTGTRTVIFLQGCPLRCHWCHNPESRSPELASGLRRYRTDELVDIILRDRSFYAVSGGGVTFSGGEPLIHIAALKDLVHMLGEEKIAVAFDTSGYFDYAAFEDALLPYTQEILYDLKIMDSDAHRKATAQENGRIIQNLRRLASTSVRIRIRIPLIPHMTATENNLREIALLMKSLGLRHYEFVSYNPSCIDKHIKLNLSPHALLPSVPMTMEEEWDCQKLMDGILGA